MPFSERLNAWMYRRLFPPLITGLVRLIYFSLPIERRGFDHIREMLRQDSRMVFAFWHGRHFLMIPTLCKMKSSVLVSTSRDGMLIADVLSRYGFEIIPGSSHKSPVRALMTCIQKVREGRNLLIAADGPTGPIYKFKAGAVFVAKKTGAAVVPIGFSSRKAVVMKSWDRFLLPLPFTRTVLCFGEPFRPSQDASSEAVEAESALLEAELNRLNTEADLAAGRTG